MQFLEKQNPAFRERHMESNRPGELLSRDSYTVGSIKGVGRILLHVVVDTYSSYAFGFLHATRKPKAAVAVVHNDVLPFYEERNITMETILTDNGREFCGTDSHPFELYLSLNDIEHRRTKVGRPQSNGFVERFLGTVKSEFFELAFWLVDKPLTAMQLTVLGFRYAGAYPHPLDLEDASVPEVEPADWENAYQCFSEALLLERNDATLIGLFVSSVLATDRLNDYGPIMLIQILNRAIELEPEESLLLEQRAALLDSVGETERAAADRQLIEELQQTDWQSFDDMLENAL